jgi:toxin ParE1/3/4
MTLVWSDRARQNLLNLIRYISEDSPARALAYADRIQARLLPLKRFPKMGRLVPELREEDSPPREILIDDYRLVYRIHHHRIEIVTLFHGMRRLPEI